MGSLQAPSGSLCYLTPRMMFHRPVQETFALILSFTKDHCYNFSLLMFPFPTLQCPHDFLGSLCLIFFFHLLLAYIISLSWESLFKDNHCGCLYCHFSVFLQNDRKGMCLQISSDTSHPSLVPILLETQGSSQPAGGWVFHQHLTPLFLTHAKSPVTVHQNVTAESKRILGAPFLGSFLPPFSLSGI